MNVHESSDSGPIGGTLDPVFSRDTPFSDPALSDLHRNVLPSWAMYATSVGSVAPTAGLALTIAGVSLTAGNET